MTHRPPAMLTLSAACVALTLAAGACSPNGADGRTPVTPSSSAPQPPTSQTAADSPEAVLAAAGLQLPPGAGGAEVETRTGLAENVEDAYRVTFVVDRAGALGFCASGGLGGDLPAVAVTDAQRQSLGLDGDPADESRLCSAQWPEDPAWQRTVLIEPGDPTTVHVGIERWSR